ncbi:MAG: MarR family winged helix-turn-helix transcriptional regulator [Acidobacteriaceae bacterium]|jgi:DNA-binding MarR family transcriptional regulator
MATANGLGKFAGQAIRVERVLNEQHIAGSVGRAVYLLSVANRGVTQKDLITELALPKDVVSKLVGSLVTAKLLTQVRQASNPRIKKLATTASGRDLVRRLKTALRPPPPPPGAIGVEGRPNVFEFGPDEPWQLPKRN